MTDYTITCTESLLRYRYNDIMERCKESRILFDECSFQDAATTARILADSANQLATLLTFIGRDQ